MAGSMKFRNPRTNQDVEVDNEKAAKILEQGGYNRVTSSTPDVEKAAPEPSTVQEHVAADKAAAKAAPRGGKAAPRGGKASSEAASDTVSTAKTDSASESDKD